MAHETHHHADNSPKTSYNSALWFVIILVGLFVAAVNFINVMGGDEAGHGAGHGATESHHPAMEQTASGTLETESGLGSPAADTTQHHGSNTATDTTHMEGH